MVIVFKITALPQKLEIQTWLSWMLWLKISHKAEIKVSQGHGLI